MLQHQTQPVERFFTPGLAQVAYLVADEEAGVAALIDPRRDVQVYLDALAARDLRLVAILETHIHADFVSGARELAAATGAPIGAAAFGEQPFVDHPLVDGDEIPIGRWRLRAIWTPGHTPEHLAYLLEDPRGEVPPALFSGDALFVGEVGRPDLLGQEATRRLAEQLYETVTERLGGLPDATVVYPGHTAGSSCGKKIGAAPQTTIGQEKLVNYAFQPRDREEFIRLVLADMPAPPTYYPVLKRVNKAGPTLLRDLPPGAALDPAQVAAAVAAGALVVDARSPDAFGAGHLPGAVFAGLGPDFTTWLGWLAPYDRDLILVLADDGDYPDALTELRRIGLDRCLGYLAGGLDAWRAAGREVVTLPQLTPAEAQASLTAGTNDFAVLDVRGPDEWASGHIPGAVHRYAGAIAQGADAPVPDTTPLAVTCGSGYRSTVACSLLQARGHQEVYNLRGGMEAWTAAGRPVTRE